MKCPANLSLAGYKTPPSVVIRLLHAAASVLRHEKDMLTSPKEQDQRPQAAVKAAVTPDGVFVYPISLLVTVETAYDSTPRPQHL